MCCCIELVASFFGINVACGDLAGVGVAKFPARFP